MSKDEYLEYYGGDLYPLIEAAEDRADEAEEKVKRLEARVAELEAEVANLKRDREEAWRANLRLQKLCDDAGIEVPR